MGFFEWWEENVTEPLGDTLYHGLRGMGISNDSIADVKPFQAAGEVKDKLVISAAEAFTGEDIPDDVKAGDLPELKGLLDELSGYEDFDKLRTFLDNNENVEGQLEKLTGGGGSTMDALREFRDMAQEDDKIFHKLDTVLNSDDFRGTLGILSNNPSMYRQLSGLLGGAGDGSTLSSIQTLYDLETNGDDAFEKINTILKADGVEETIATLSANKEVMGQITELMGGDGSGSPSDTIDTLHGMVVQSEGKIFEGLNEMMGKDGFKELLGNLGENPDILKQISTLTGGDGAGSPAEALGEVMNLSQGDDQLFVKLNTIIETPGFSETLANLSTNSAMLGQVQTLMGATSQGTDATTDGSMQSTIDSLYEVVVADKTVFTDANDLMGEEGFSDVLKTLSDDTALTKQLTEFFGAEGDGSNPAALLDQLKEYADTDPNFFENLNTVLKADNFSDFVSTINKNDSLMEKIRGGDGEDADPSVVTRTIATFASSAEADDNYFKTASDWLQHRAGLFSGLAGGVVSMFAGDGDGDFGQALNDGMAMDQGFMGALLSILQGVSDFIQKIFGGGETEAKVGNSNDGQGPADKMDIKAQENFDADGKPQKPAPKPEDQKVKLAEDHEDKPIVKEEPAKALGM